MKALQDNVTAVVNWFRKSRIHVNASKTEIMCFRSPRKQALIDIPLLLHADDYFPCCCSHVQYVDSCRYLGVHFDSDLTWSTHITFVCSTLRSA